MSDIAIRVEDLSKLYRIGEHQGGYKTLRETIVNTFSAPFRHLHRNPQSAIRNSRSDCIWALKEVSFEVKRGEVVGIIGRNGAGKTTLLKILSRITEPTKGWAEIHGRVGSLLEVGTGFHLELTGRENIYLNGTILGMKKAEIQRKFDEIVAFAEIEKFIDTPVKRYSSGMYVRLAFAVAAHLEPEILLVDEVLAVGDAAFQKKCLGKMGDVAREGRTVLFVSHNMAAVNNLCGRTILLNEGELVLSGKPNIVIGNYLTRTATSSRCWNVDGGKLGGDGPVQITAIDVLDVDGEPLQDLATGGGFILRIQYELEEKVKIPSASFVVRLKNYMDVEVLRLSNTPISGFPIESLSGMGHIDLMIPVVPFTGGKYFFDVALGRKRQGFYTELIDVLSIYIRSRDIYRSGTALDQSHGLGVVVHRWIHQQENMQAADSGWIGRKSLLHSQEEGSQ